MDYILLDNYREHIDQKRSAFGMSVAELARRTGVSRVTMSRFLNRHAMVSVETINKCLSVLDVARGGGAPCPPADARGNWEHGYLGDKGVFPSELQPCKEHDNA